MKMVRTLSVGYRTADIDTVLFTAVLPKPAALLARATIDTEKGIAQVDLYWPGDRSFLLHYTEMQEEDKAFLYIKQVTWEEMLREPVLHPLLVSANLLVVDLDQALRLSDWLAESAQTGEVPNWLDPYNGERGLD